MIRPGGGCPACDMMAKAANLTYNFRLLLIFIGGAAEVFTGQAQRIATPLRRYL